MLGIARKCWPVPNPGPADAGVARAGSSFSWRRRVRTNIAQILKNIGIGWLVLVLVSMFVTLALALSNGGPAVPYSRSMPLRSATVARCSVADSWPSDGAVKDVKSTRADLDEHALRTNRLGWVPSGTCQRATCSSLAGSVARNGRSPMRDFQQTLELAQNSTDVRGAHRA